MSTGKKLFYISVIWAVEECLISRLYKNMKKYVIKYFNPKEKHSIQVSIVKFRVKVSKSR
jgi:hypothetical protein